MAYSKAVIAIPNVKGDIVINVTTAPIEVSYTNLAVPNATNTTDKTIWVNGYRLNSSGAVEAKAGKTVSNKIACTHGDIIRIKGITLEESVDRVMTSVINASGSEVAPVGYFQNGASNTLRYDGLVDGVYTFTVLNYNGQINYFRFSMTTPKDASSVIITVNEEII